MKSSIIYVGGFEMPDKNAAAHQVLNNARIFYSLGYDVAFCGLDHDLHWGDKPIEQVASIFESYPRAYPKTVLQWIINMTSISHVKSIIEDKDDVKLVVAYNMHALPLLRLISYCKRKRIKIVANATEWYENKFSLKPLGAIK